MYDWFIEEKTSEKFRYNFVSCIYFINLIKMSTDNIYFCYICLDYIEQNAILTKVPVQAWNSY